jgi:hypothetical protein
MRIIDNFLKRYVYPKDRGRYSQDNCNKCNIELYQSGPSTHPMVRCHKVLSQTRCPNRNASRRSFSRLLSI